MKRVFLLAIIFSLCTVAAQAQKIGEKIQIEHNGSWYDGKILKIEADKYYVSYDGWSEDWNEWVTIDKLKGFSAAAPLTKFKVGDKVEVEYGMIPEPATVIEVGENKYQIEYEKKAFGKKWVTEKQIKKL
jgi:hypothetical protein